MDAVRITFIIKNTAREDSCQEFFFFFFKALSCVSRDVGRRNWPIESVLKRNHLSIILGMNQPSSFVSAGISMMARLRQSML